MVIVKGHVRFEIDFSGGTLWRVQNRGKENKHLTPKAWRVLEYLVSTPPKTLIRKEEILNHVWGVESYEASLTKVIRELREALGDDPNDPAFIETVHGRGYRFIAEKEELHEEPPNVNVPTKPPVESSGSGGRPNEQARAAEVEPGEDPKVALTVHVVLNGSDKIQRLMISMFVYQTPEVLLKAVRTAAGIPSASKVFSIRTGAFLANANTLEAQGSRMTFLWRPTTWTRGCCKPSAACCCEGLTLRSN